ncbi:hypothetical protein [Xenorhabdus littoralis]|nr:hypothetical protein [Xenorhabdus sp. psl]
MQKIINGAINISARCPIFWRNISAVAMLTFFTVQAVVTQTPS